MDKIKLSRTPTGWKYGDIIITKHEWKLPFVSISYRAVVNGIKVDTDTLREMREYILENS